MKFRTSDLLGLNMRTRRLIKKDTKELLINIAYAVISGALGAVLMVVMILESIDPFFIKEALEGLF